MEFKNWINPHELIKRYYKKLKSYKVPLDGGNCGQVSIAIFLKLKEQNIKSEIGLITNAEDKEELVWGDIDVYHVYNIINNQRFDENGEISMKYLIDLSKDQYGNHNPFEFVFNESEIDKLKTIVRTQTNWTYYFEWFLNRLNK